ATHDGWTVAVINPTVTPVDFQFQALCIANVTPTFASAMTALASTTVGAAATTCDAGQAAGGGFDIADNGTGVGSTSMPTRLSASPPGRGWTATGRAGARDR